MAFWPKRKHAPQAQIETKASATAGLGGATVWLGSHAQWSSWSYTQTARRAVQSNPVVQRCLRVISEGAASIPWQVHDGHGALETHPLLDLLKRPNPMAGRAQLIESVISYLVLHGDAYLECVRREEGGMPAELYALRPDRMTIQPGASGWPSAYIYKVEGKSLRFAVDPLDGRCDILHLKECNPLEDHYGLSALQAALKALDLHDAADGWSKSLLDNAARPSGALIVKGEDGYGSLSEEQFDRLRDQITENFQGAANAGRPMVLEGGLRWQQMGFSPSDMDFQATKQAAARDIALAFGVPPMLLGIPGDNTYANYQEANKALWRLTIMPLLSRILDAMNMWLAPEYGSDVRIVIDHGAVPALAADREAYWRQVAGADFLSADEKRRLLGLPPASQTVSEEGN